MKRLMTVLALSLIAATLQAEELVGLEAPAKPADKTCTAECATGCTASCPIEAAMAKLPKLTYMVGQESTCCSEAAAKLAKEHDAPVKFVVAEKTFDSEGAAMTALVAATEKFVADFTTTKECKVSGKFTVAGKELCCNVMAGERAALAKKAMDNVKLAYLVGEKECSCPVEATTLAKATGETKQFVVAGEKTCCDVTARLKLARAKYKAAVEALAKQDAPQPAEKS